MGMKSVDELVLFLLGILEVVLVHFGRLLKKFRLVFVKFLKKSPYGDKLPQRSSEP